MAAAPMRDDPTTGNDTSPAVMLSPNARKRVFDNCASFEIVTLNEHDAVRFSPSTAVQVTVVAPIGNVVPEPGRHDTLTGLCPAVAVGGSKWSAMPAASIVAREMPSTHDSDGGLATGGGGGTGGVGAVGVLLHAAATAMTVTADTKPERIAQDFRNLMNMN
jgi:hypothetical protein